jgi:serine/threonine protein kinase
VTQIKQEISILTKLFEAMKSKLCPFINKIYECIENDTHYFIILEFCEQGTLLEILNKKKRLPE